MAERKKKGRGMSLLMGKKGGERPIFLLGGGEVKLVRARKQGGGTFLRHGKKRRGKNSRLAKRWVQEPWPARRKEKGGGSFLHRRQEKRGGGKKREEVPSLSLGKGRRQKNHQWSWEGGKNFP